MRKVLAVITVLLLAGCGSVPQGQVAQSPCQSNPGGYECQIENYFRAPH